MDEQGEGESEARDAGAPNAPHAGVRDWDALVRQHDRRVVVALLARGIPIVKARELAQEAWSVLFQRHAEGAPEGHVFPGLAIQQAIFLALSERRKAERRGEQTLEEFDLDRELADPLSDPEASAVSRERIDRARAALARCAPSARRAFCFVYESPERTYKEVALELGLSEQRVKQIVCEVRAELRRAIVGGES